MLTLDQYQQLADIFSDHYASHVPQPGDVYVFESPKALGDFSIHAIVKVDQKVGDHELWAPTTRQLLMLAAFRGLQIGKPYWSDDRRAWLGWVDGDPTLKASSKVDKDEPIFKILVQWHARGGIVTGVRPTPVEVPRSVFQRI